MDFSTLVLAIFVFAVVLVVMGVRRVPQGVNYTVERFGRYIKTLDPKLHLIVPAVDRIGSKMKAEREKRAAIVEAKRKGDRAPLRLRFLALAGS